jgi:3-oxoacyl-[acyl-carrier-protein] synthase II
MMSREVWVTGCGAVSAAGIGTPPLEQALLEERLCVSVERVEGPPLGRAPDLPPSREGRRLDRSARLFLASATEAWDQAGLDVERPRDASRVAVVEGSSLGPMTELIDAARRLGHGCCRRTRPTDIIRFMTGAGGAAFAQSHGIGGPVLHVSGGSISGACAIGEAALWISCGRVDVAVAGGAESPLHGDIVGLFGAAGILAQANGDHADPDVRGGNEPACRPFDVHRCGTVLGEGSGIVVLEAAEHARARGCAPLAVLVGYGTGCEAHSMTAPDPDGSAVTAAVRQALGDGPCGVLGSSSGPASCTDATSIGWIKAHATGTRRGDASECRGLDTALGVALRCIPISGLKSQVGHCLGASGAVEAVASILALGRGIIPATLGTQIVDPDLPACIIATRAAPLREPHALLLSQSFGGRSAALLMRAV